MKKVKMKKVFGIISKVHSGDWDCTCPVFAPYLYLS